MQTHQLLRAALLLLFLPSSVRLTLCGSYDSPSQNMPFTLGPNLINNPNISTPIIDPYYFTAYTHSVNGWTTKGKYVEIIDACLEQGYGKTCPKFMGISCGWQFIDVDSIRNNEQYYQQVELLGGREFQLQFDWISETASNIGSMGLSVDWNNLSIFTIFDISCTLHTSTFYLMSKEGSNQLVFSGVGTADSAGIMLRNIRLQEITYSWSECPVNFWNLTTVMNEKQFTRVFTVFYSLKQLPLIGWIQLFPVIKTTFQFVFRLTLEFNHLLLYNYHRMNFTNMSSIILAGVQTLDDERGFLLDAYVYPNIGTSPQAIAYDQQHTAIPANMNKVVTSYMQRPNSIRLQLADAIFMDFPIIVIIFAFGCVIFRLLYRYTLSLLLRPFSLIGCLLIALLAGKIEVFTFHFLSEALFLVSVNFWRKLQATAIIYAYFTVFLFAVSSMLLFRAIYGKTLKYMFDFCKYPHSSYMFATFLLVFDVLLGFAHRLLLNFPFFQLCTLIVIEVICLVILLMYLFQCRISKIGFGVTFCAMNCARLAFITTLLIFHISPAYKDVLSTIQQYLFYIMLGLWGISMLTGLLHKIRTVFLLIGRICKDVKARQLAYRVEVRPFNVQSKIKQTDVIKTTQQHDLSSRLELLKKRMKPAPKTRKGNKLISAQILNKKLIKK